MAFFQEATITTVIGRTLPEPTAAMLRDASLMLDFDGTLVGLYDRPDAVVVDPPLTRLLERLVDTLSGRVAIVTGRSLAQIEELLGPVAGDLALCGSHGAELRLGGVTERPERPVALDEVATSFRAFAEDKPGMIVEIKTLGVGLHYRIAPEHEEEAKALATRLGRSLGLAVQHGKMMVELRSSGNSKGTGIARLMAQSPLDAGRPVFVGDDVTDEDGFEAVRDMGGHGVLVGEPRPTAASHALADPDAVRRWLAEVAA